MQMKMQAKALSGRQPGSIGRFRHLAFLLLFIMTNAIAQEALSRDFLDYMADFQTEDGEWIDPEELETMVRTSSEYEATSSSHQSEDDTHE
jgi:hypothetical protein